MKKIAFILFLAGCSLGVMGQNTGADTSIHKNVNDDGKTMHIKLSYSIDGKLIQKYKQSFPIAGMSKADKEALVNHIMDSLGIPNTPPSPPPAPPKPPKPPKQKRFAQLSPAKNTILYTNRYA